MAIDFVIGVAAAVSSGTLRLSYLADVMKNDVLGKLVPWAVLYIGSKLADEELAAGITFVTLRDAAFGLIVLAIGGSILKSLAELGLLGEKAQGVATGGARGSADATPALRALVAPEHAPRTGTPATPTASTRTPG